MTTKRTLSIHQPEDILGYIPHMLGYWPEDSLVAITMQGKVLGATLRVDLPSGTSRRAVAAFAEQVRSYLVADEDANGVVLALYTDDGWTEGAVLEKNMPLLEALRECLDQVDLSVLDAWLVGSLYWRSAYCSDTTCCPFPGLPVQRIKDSRLSAELVFRGSTIGPSPKNGLGKPLPAMSGALNPKVLESEARFGERILGRWRSELCLDAVLAVWQHVLTRAVNGDLLQQGNDAGLMGFLRTTLKVPAWRDAVLVMAAAGIESAKSGAEAFGLFVEDGVDILPFDPTELGIAAPLAQPESTQPSGSDWMTDIHTYGDVLLGMQPPVPSWAHLDALQQVLAGLSIEGESGVVAAAALTLQGWISWGKGSGSIAHAFLSRAEAAHPGYRLAELMMDILGQGNVCEWARRPSSAWRGPKDAVL
ncbi:DUF4192 domain-containing protein [Paenarthrobacter nitroguajacolicus]|uniref:DUF4192 domain-containing protein n=1 Tax=Paenarthrobacter nitroguajacolicus TaxID=211146 RepID=A0A558GSS9_PAENT|nr:DUF4192 domain-containing protein [Paenarthrobacter nitroguajacolicus]TVU59934.1 DUF4192 domain-containing protein [Paenarthrobacter nitroguajacolicus]